MNREEKYILRSWARDSGIKLSEAQVHHIGIHLDELWRWNKRMNLTGLSSRQGIIRELIIDSLIPSTFLPEMCLVLDVGSGAGFPAIPLKICRADLSFHLMEANSKKVRFLRQVIRLTMLQGIAVVRGRIEKNKDLLRPEGYAVITARALAQLPQTLSWCAPCLRAGGMILNFQGNRFEHALKESADVMKRERLFLDKSFPYTIPVKHSRRHVLIFKKY